MDPLLDSLNAAQRSAVTSPANVLQILAPPGSGKTKTLTSRVAYLLRHCEYKPWNIICLTFTIKSAKEMKERISRLLGNGVESRLILGTFHSVCRRYLVTYGHLIGIRKGFGIADTSDTLGIIKRVIKRRGLSIEPRKAQARISGLKSKGIDCSTFAKDARKKSVEQQEICLVFEGYEEQLTTSHHLDYDDLLLRCVELLSQHPACVSNVETVLIDEFQDTNVVQFDLMRLFAAKNERVTTVGDPDQSIYGWRSAEIKNLERMQEQFPDTLVVHLEDNYRSSGAILLAAREVIEQDVSRPQKSLLPTHCPGTVPVLRKLPTAEAEATWTVTEIQRIIGLTGHLLNYSDFAILLRSASISRLLESAMGRAGIPYRMVGGQRFFDRSEIKILLDYLRVISQPENNDALTRIINVPTRGVGAATSKSLLEEAEVQKSTVWRLIQDVVQGNKLPKTKVSKTAEQGLASFTDIILSSRKKLHDSHDPQSPEDLLRFLIKKLDFLIHLKKSHAEDYEARGANVEELVAQSSEFRISSNNNDIGSAETDALPLIEGLDHEAINEAEEALSRFLANVALATELQKEDGGVEGAPPQSQVTISTIHASKGLEWPAVFVLSVFDGCIPHSRAEDVDEERRLLYVAMTRAQALLYVSCPVKNSQRENTTLSPFLADKKVRRLLTNQGPGVETSTVVDIARILRRDCPPGARILEMKDGLRSHHDDLWPPDGTATTKTKETRGSRWDTDPAGRDGQGAKRRRIMGDERSGANITYTHPSIRNLTTMESASTFSYTSKGFTTASAHLQVEAVKEGGDRQSEDPSKGKDRSSNSRIEPPRSDRGTLLRLWGVNGKNKPRSEERDLVLDPSGSGRAQRIASVPIDVNAKAPFIRNSRTIHPAIPQALATHRLRPIQNYKVRPSHDQNDHLGHKPYVFLSSSPQAPETERERGEVAENDPSLDDNMDRMEDDAHSPNGRTQDVKPAKTFHSTSIDQLQSPSVSGKRMKTLGVRRSMAGWKAGPKNAFSVPKMPVGQP